MEILVYYRTNKYNVETLENPPAFEPTHYDEWSDYLYTPCAVEEFRRRQGIACIV